MLQINTIRPQRRQILKAVYGGLCASSLPYAVFAQTGAWRPTRPIEIVIGVGPGGGTDRAARDVAKLLRSNGYAPNGVIVNNKPGGGHAVALAYTISQAGNPHVLQITGQIIVANNVLGRSPLSYKQVTPLAKLYDEPVVFASNRKSGIVHAQDLIERLKKNPSSVSFSISTGIGTTQHIAVLQLGQQLGISSDQIKAISFNSSAEGVTAAVGGHIDIAVTSTFALNPFVESGDLRYIAIGGNRRGSGLLKEIPTWKELGYEVVVTSSPLVVGPPQLNVDQLAYWNHAFAAITQTSEWKAILQKNQLTSAYLDSNGATAFYEDADRRYRALLGNLIKR